MEEAGRIAPSNLGILLDLGFMHGLRYNYADADRCFEQAVRVAPNKLEGLLAVGQRSRDFGNFTMAEKYYKRALEQKNVSPAALVKLADVYERLQRPEESASLLDRALHMDAACAPAIVQRARLNRQAKQLTEAELRLRNFPPSAESALRADAAYELGAILDQQSRHDEAMASFFEAKKILLPNAAPFMAGLKVSRQRIQDIYAKLTAETLRNWFATTATLIPNRRLALVGGHPRSGTTLLDQVMDSHPDIISADETEIFHTESYLPLTRSLPVDSPAMSILEAASINTLTQSRNNYFESIEKFLNQPIGNRLLIDKNPSLTLIIPVLIRFFPEIKLLIALRDPRDVVLSCFMQPFKLGTFNAPYLTLEGCVEEYIFLMRIWQELKPMISGHYLEVRYEDMVEDLESVARKSLDFLGVPWDAGVLHFNEHARKKAVRSPTYADVTQPVYKRAKGRWRNYQKYLEPHLEKLEPFVKAFGYE